MDKYQVICASERPAQTPRTAGFAVKADSMESAREIAGAIVADQQWRVVAVTTDEESEDNWIPETPDNGEVVVDGTDFESRCWYCGYSYPENYACHAGVVGVITATGVHVWYCSKRCRESHEIMLECDVEITAIGTPEDSRDEGLL